MKSSIVVGISLLFLCCDARIGEKILLCGVCKDVASRVPYSIRIMEKIGELFDDYRVVVYENNSSDNTPDILRRWGEANPKVLAIGEYLEPAELEHLYINRLEHNEFFRPEAIARARNIVLDYALSGTYDDYKYLIWMDMDFKKEPNYEAFEEIFSTEKQWDAVFAYGVDPRVVYWDWYAFRDEQTPIGSELLGNDWWYLPKVLTLTEQDDWYPVYSAFGGCGIYAKQAIQGCRYSALVTPDLGRFCIDIIMNNPSHPLVQKYYYDLQQATRRVKIDEPDIALPDERDPQTIVSIAGISDPIMWRMSSFVYKYPSVCEHVPFHASMIIRGYDKLFINPRLIFRYGG